MHSEHGAAREGPDDWGIIRSSAWFYGSSKRTDRLAGTTTRPRGALVAATKRQSQRDKRETTKGIR